MGGREGWLRAVPPGHEGGPDEDAREAGQAEAEQERAGRQVLTEHGCADRDDEGASDHARHGPDHTNTASLEAVLEDDEAGRPGTYEDIDVGRRGEQVEIVPDDQGGHAFRPEAAQAVQESGGASVDKAPVIDSQLAHAEERCRRRYHRRGRDERRVSRAPRFPRRRRRG